VLYYWKKSTRTPLRLVMDFATIFSAAATGNANSIKEARKTILTVTKKSSRTNQYIRKAFWDGIDVLVGALSKARGTTALHVLYVCVELLEAFVPVAPSSDMALLHTRFYNVVAFVHRLKRVCCDLIYSTLFI
jgi:hypothetical protein